MTVTEAFIPTQASTVTADMTRTVIVGCASVAAKFMFGQDQRTLRIMVVSILSLEMPVD
jgi:hypothetical protein